MSCSGGFRVFFTKTRKTTTRSPSAVTRSVRLDPIPAFHPHLPQARPQIADVRLPDPIDSELINQQHDVMEPRTPPGQMGRIPRGE